MSDKVSVMAVFNTIKEIKPLWLLRNGEKYKIEQIISSYEVHGLMVFHCMITGECIALYFDVDKALWSVERSIRF